MFAFRAWVPSGADWKGTFGSFSSGGKALPAAPATLGPREGAEGLGLSPPGLAR